MLTIFVKYAVNLPLHIKTAEAEMHRDFYMLENWSTNTQFTRNGLNFLIKLVQLICGINLIEDVKRSNKNAYQKLHNILVDTWNGKCIM